MSTVTAPPTPLTGGQPPPPQVDPYNGRFIGARGGSELMYDTLEARLPAALWDRFQLIVSRVREFRPGRKAVLWCQDTWDDPEARHLARLDSRLRFKKIVFVSHWQFNGFHQGLRVPYSESAILRNAVDPIAMTPPPKPTDRVNLVYHTTPHRGLEILVPVFVALAAQHPRLHLDVYSSFGLHGWDGRDAAYAALFDVCRSHPQITYHGAAPNPEIREALLRAHIFAYPSVWPETSCVASIEAMSAGCVVVCPDLAALAETVPDMCGVGYRWTEHTREHANRFAAALSSAIALVERGDQQEIVGRAQHRVSVLFNWQTRLGDWATLLERIIEDDERTAAASLAVRP